MRNGLLNHTLNCLMTMGKIIIIIILRRLFIFCHRVRPVPSLCISRNTMPLYVYFTTISDSAIELIPSRSCRTSLPRLSEWWRMKGARYIRTARSPLRGPSNSLSPTMCWRTGKVRSFEWWNCPALWKVT